MRRCFPHIGGQTKTPPEPRFTRRCLHVSTALTIEPPSRSQYTCPDKERHTSWRPSWHLHHLSRCMPSAIPVAQGHYRTDGRSGYTSWRHGPTGGTVGPWWILGPGRLSTHTHRPGDAWESDEVVQSPQPAGARFGPASVVRGCAGASYPTAGPATPSGDSGRRKRDPGACKAGPHESEAW